MNSNPFDVSYLPPKVFISYSHTDKEFVKQLSQDLLKNRIVVWWDDWEINVGESLIEKIQVGIKSSAYLGIILTPESVSSKWVREELNAGFMRQLEERRIFILPILLRDCVIPLFLQDKKYADFRSDYSEGLELLLNGIKPINILNSDRIDSKEYHHDYYFDWGMFDKNYGCRLTITSHGKEYQFSILSEIILQVNSSYSKRLADLFESGIQWGPKALMLSILIQNISKEDSVYQIENEKITTYKSKVVDPKTGYVITYQISSRIMGNNPSGACIFDWKSMIIIIMSSILENIETSFGPDEYSKYLRWLKQNPIQSS